VEVKVVVVGARRRRTRSILHLTPAWSWDSGVAFQKKRIMCTHMTGGSREISDFLFHTASRPSTAECFSMEPDRP
jgi:hypothetical protein